MIIFFKEYLDKYKYNNTVQDNLWQSLQQVEFFYIIVQNISDS